MTSYFYEPRAPCPDCPEFEVCEQPPACPADQTLLVHCLIAMQFLLLCCFFAGHLRSFLEWLSRKADYLSWLLAVAWVCLGVLVGLHMTQLLDLHEVLRATVLR